MDILFLILALILMIVGLIGVVLPVIPSIPVIYGGFLVYGLGTGWKDYGAGLMVALGIITLLILALDYLAGAMGARKFGGSRTGMIGSVVGAVVGLIVFNVIGLIVGVFAGAVMGELLQGRTTHEAIRSGWGAFLGFVAGSVFKLIMGVSMIGGFLILVIF